MRITSAGQVGIGTAQTGGSLNRQLEVYSNAGSSTGNTYARFGIGSAGAYGGNVHLEFAYNDYGNTNVFTVPAKITAILDPDGSGHGNGNLAFYTKGTAGSGAATEKVRITSGGLLQAKYGISFPSPANTSDTAYNSGAATLNAYEEGTWTPAITGLVLNISYAKYVRVGSIITIAATFNYTSGTGSGYKISGLPYTSQGAHRSGISYANVKGINFGSGATAPTGYIGGTTSISLFGFRNDNTYTIADLSSFGAGDFMEFSATYNII